MPPTRAVLALAALPVLGVAGCAAPKEGARATPEAAHPAAPPAGDIDAHIAGIAKIGRDEAQTPPKVDVARVMQELDEHWGALGRAGEAGQVRIRVAIDDEVARGSPRNDFLLLDLARFLVEAGGDGNAKSTVKALGAIDPDGPGLHRSWVDLFRLTHAVARGRPEIRAVIDRDFLGRDRAVVLPGDHLPLASHIVTTYLYGVTGPDAEDHLTSLLARPDAPRSDVLEALTWLGTERSVDAVASLLRTDGSKETVGRAVTVLMQVGGPRGRDAVLAVDASHLAADARAYLDGIRPDVTALTGKELAAPFAQFHGPDHVGAKELRERLDRMVANEGRDDDLNPNALIKSDLPTKELVARLAAVRSAQLRSLTHQSIEDVETTNALIEAIEWRER